MVVENRSSDGAFERVEAAPNIALLRGSARRNCVGTRRCDAHVDDGAALSAGSSSPPRRDRGVRERAGSLSVHEYGELGVVANFATGREHRGIAYQWFRPDGVLALLPLPGRRVSMVWSAPEARGRALLETTPAELASEIEAASAGVLGTLETITPAAAFPLKRQRVERSSSRASRSSAMPPTRASAGGQGVNLAFATRASLRPCWNARPGTIAGVQSVRKYERAARRTLRRSSHDRRAGETFSSRWVWLAGLRNLGLSLVDMQLR